jgi:hypothetical protein
VSRDLAAEIRLGLEELATIREQLNPLISMPPDATVGVIETAAACAMLHSFYTEIEKILKLIAREWDGRCLRRIRGTKICSTKCPRRPPSGQQSFRPVSSTC